MKRFPTLQADISAAANEALDRFREESRRTVIRLVDMESGYLTVEFFRKMHPEPEKKSDPKNPNRSTPNPNLDSTDSHLSKIGK